MQLKQTLTSIAAALLLGSLAHAADTYKIDPAHTSIGFSVRHLGLSNVKGQFKEFAGVIVLDDGKITEASGTIQVKSVDTGDERVAKVLLHLLDIGRTHINGHLPNRLGMPIVLAQLLGKALPSGGSARSC
ncbi:MAG: YceI family protein [Limisphaerales bacterium]